jgi:hypothetical protein
LCRFERDRIGQLDSGKRLAAARRQAGKGTYAAVDVEHTSCCGRFRELRKSSIARRRRPAFALSISGRGGRAWSGCIAPRRASG